MKIIIRSGESNAPLIDAQQLNHCHRMERERSLLILLDEVEKGLADVAAGRTRDAQKTLRRLKAKSAV